MRGKVTLPEQSCGDTAAASFSRISSKSAVQYNSRSEAVTGVCLISILVIFALPSLFACQPSSSWLDAASETAPPNPESSEIRAARGGRQPGEQLDAGAPAAEPASSDANDSTDRVRDTRGAEGQSGRVDLEVYLEGERSCFAGAVRCYLDGRYVGAIGSDGRFRTAVSPGGHILVVWDSRGRWDVDLMVSSGDVLRIPIRCADRREHGAY